MLLQIKKITDAINNLLINKAIVLDGISHSLSTNTSDIVSEPPSIVLNLFYIHNMLYMQFNRNPKMQFKLTRKTISHTRGP